MAMYGYARISPWETTSSLQLQIAQLEAAGCVRVFSDSDTPPSLAGGPGWTALVRELGAGDTASVTKLDRAIHSLQAGRALTSSLAAVGASLRILDSQDRADGSALGIELLPEMVNILLEFEKDLLSERKRAGLAAGVHLRR